MRSDSSSPLRAAVVGYGAYGSLHARKYLEHPGVRLVAVVDCNPARLCAARNELPGVKTFNDPDALIGLADIASVVVPATRHHAIARRLLEGSTHLLVEKPFTASLAEARELSSIAEAHERVLQPGYLERFNRTLSELRARLPSPRYVEARRLTRWRDRGRDVNVVMDLMIHDIDMLLALTDSPVTHIQARGVRVFSDQWDVVNAQLHFVNGCVANLTASRASPESERRLHVFSEHACALADIDTGTLHLHQRKDGASGVITECRFRRHGDPLADEIDAFVQAVRLHHPPPVTAMDACCALNVAERITELMEPDDDLLTRTSAPLTNSERAIAYLLQQRDHARPRHHPPA
ncbi:MAG TPA: Gfo/Idh/MocA family oxidoreductase [Gammaproteobacteria bacterium]